MVFKLNISENGKAWKIEQDSEAWIGRKIGEKIKGSEISSDLEGYELEISGTSDIAGFPGKKDEEGANLRGVLLTKGFSCWTKPKGLRKHPIKRLPEGIRLKKTLRGNTLSKDTVQINLKVLKSGSKKLETIFPEQNKPKEKKVESSEEKKEETQSHQNP
ncbi:MAG: 30S ribosomal protein S6e [Nanoarchaeota archaeon]|nr:30S ribosomal protein S6e [Nanoarchaeota archaeon]